MTTAWLSPLQTHMCMLYVRSILNTFFYFSKSIWNCFFFLKKCILNKYFWSKCKKHINHYRAQLYPEHYDNILICHCFQCEKNHTKNPTYAKHTKSVMCAYALIHRFKVTASTWQFNGRGGKWSRSGCRAARVVKAGCSRGIVGENIGTGSVWTERPS